MRKHSITVQSSSPATGYGLFTTDDMAAGTSIPIKGPWFKTTQELEQYFSELHERTAEQFRSRVISIRYRRMGAPPEEQHNTAYLVMTSVVGMVNHFRSLANRPNCKLVLNPDMPLCDYSLKLNLAVPVPKGKELLINYGPMYPVGEVQPKRRRVTGRVRGWTGRKKGSVPTPEA